MDDEKTPDAAPLFVPPGHFYSPITNRPEMRAHFKRLRSDGQVTALAGIDVGDEKMQALWGALVPYLNDSPYLGPSAGQMLYQFRNSAFGPADALMLQAMLRHFRPRRYYEIGCGWSTACAVDTITADPELHTEMVLFEPYPKLVNKLIGPANFTHRLVKTRIQDVDLAEFDALEAGDFLFIDSTHVMRTASDVHFEFFEILPRLRPGVIVHFHDVFWPFEYPQAWALRENRAWNEIYALRAYLTHNPKLQIVMFSSYMIALHRALVTGSCPAFIDADLQPRFMASPGSIWLQCC